MIIMNRFWTFGLILKRLLAISETSQRLAFWMASLCRTGWRKSKHDLEFYHSALSLISATKYSSHRHKQTTDLQEERNRHVAKNTLMKMAANQFLFSKWLFQKRYLNVKHTCLRWRGQAVIKAKRQQKGLMIFCQFVKHSASK